MILNLDSYRQNKETYRNISKFQDFCIQEFPDKTWGFVGLTALLFSQLAIETYLSSAKVDPRFIPAMKSTLWQFMNLLTEGEKKERGEDWHG